KSSDEEDDDDQEDNDDQDNDNDQDDGDERIDSDNDGDDFVHPKFSTHDEEDKEEDRFDHRVQTPSHVESTDDEDSDEEIQGANVEKDKQDKEETNEEVKANELYRDVKSIWSTIESFCVIWLYVPVTTLAEPPLLSIITPPPPSTPLIKHLQQTPVPTPATVPSSSLQDLPNFGSLFGFDHRLKTLENNFSEFNQTNQFAVVVSLIPDIVDAYLANKMHESVKTVVQLQSERLRDEAQAENVDFINKLDDNINKIIKNQVKEQVKAQVSKIFLKIEKTVNEQLKAEILIRSSNESKTSHAIAVNLSELELKKILIDKMESNKSIHISNEQKNLYKTLSRDDEDKDEEPSAGSNRGSKRRRAGKEPESTSAPKEKTSKTTSKSTEGSKSHHKSAGKSTQVEEPMYTAKDLEEPAHQEFETGVTEDQHNKETSQLPNCSLAQIEDPRESFNELMDTPLDFSAFVMNRLKVDTLTPELLAGPTFELMKGTCKSLVELEYFFEEVYKATTKKLDWNNPEGQQYPHDLQKPLPLIPNSRGCQVIPFDHFINNDLAYLCGGVSSRTYANSVTKTKAADYGHIKWIEELVPNIIWS
ncbi:hypothetical protein Tco_0513215, partial [Tanacetum coccineum]